MLTLKETAQWLKERDNFLILTHRSPDGDTLGSGAGLCVALRELGKTAYLLKNPDVPEDFAYLVEGLESEDFTPDFVVATDIATEELFIENAEIYKGKVDLSIDHHPPRDLFGKENCVIHEKAACGELVYEIVSQWGKISQAVAKPLYVAIATDTGCFVYGNTTAETHHVAGDLMETGLEVRSLNKALFQTVTLKQLQVESRLVDTMKLFNDGNVAFVFVTQGMLQEINATDRDIEDISSFIAKVEGVKAGATLREKTNGTCRISMRTDPNYLKANEVCVELGGGGHDAASGATYHGDIEGAFQTLVSVIEKTLGEKLMPVTSK